MFGKLRKTQDNPHNNSRKLLKSKYNFLFTFSKTELMRRREKKSDACFNLAVLVGPVCVFLPSLWNKTQVLKCPRGKNSVGHRPPQINMFNWQTAGWRENKKSRSHNRLHGVSDMLKWWVCILGFGAAVARRCCLFQQGTVLVWRLQVRIQCG